MAGEEEGWGLRTREAGQRIEIGHALTRERKMQMRAGQMLRVVKRADQADLRAAILQLQIDRVGDRAGAQGEQGAADEMAGDRGGRIRALDRRHDLTAAKKPAVRGGKTGLRRQDEIGLVARHDHGGRAVIDDQGAELQLGCVRVSGRDVQRVVIAPIRKLACRDGRVVQHDTGERDGAVADKIPDRHADAKLVDMRQGRRIRRKVLRIANGQAACRDNYGTAQPHAKMLNADRAADRGRSPGVDEGNEPIPVPENGQQKCKNDQRKQQPEPHSAAHAPVSPVKA